METRTKYLFLSFIIAVTLTDAYAQNTNICYENLTILNKLSTVRNAEQHAIDVMQNNEFERNGLGNSTNIYTNPLVLNREILDYKTFDLNSRGILTVVKGKPETAEAMPIPFYVSIRRNGIIVEDKKMSFLNKKLYKVNLSDVFPFSKHGDVLIINPVNPEDWKAKRILKLMNMGC
jgi:hypothetical protein